MATDAPAAKPQRRFRPRLIPTLLAIPMLGVLIGLGNWQARRYGETSAKVQEYRRQHDELPAVTTLDVAGPEKNRLATLHFRRASLRGQIDASQLRLLTARYKLGQRGWGILAPLQVASGPHARVLVNLGWVPIDKLDSYLASLKTQGPVMISGRLRQVSDVQNDMLPVSQHQDREVWLVANPAALAKKIEGLDPQLMLDAGEQAMGNPVDLTKLPLDGYEYPIHPQASKHIEYAATWYGLAATLVAVWVALSRRKEA